MKSYLSLLCCLFLFSQQGQTQVNPCDFHLVVLGSSTAAGTGPSSPDSAWVNRYTDYLKNMDPHFIVTNLAEGGRTTYHIMPDDFVPPANRPATLPEKNITKAIAIGATAIIVNMPSNDSSQGFSAAEQLANYAEMKTTADAAGIPIYICTTQPRNFGSAILLQIQSDVKDGVLATYGDKAIDFWTDIADPASFWINVLYDSGDGVHLNDAGHGILFDRVSAKEIVRDNSEQDYGISDLELIASSPCGGSAEIFAKLNNFGPTVNEEVDVNVYLDGTLIGSLSLQAPDSCDDLAFSYNIDLPSGASFTVSCELANQDPTNNSNNSDSRNGNTLALPDLMTSDGVACIDNEAILTATTTIINSTIRWYNDNDPDNAIAEGGIFTTPPLSGDATFFAEVTDNNTGCVSEQQQVDVEVSDPQIDLGADVTLIVGEMITLDAGNEVIDYQWNGTAGSQMLTFDALESNIGENIIIVLGYNENGCEARDEITITVKQVSSAYQLSGSEVLIFPIPADNYLHVKNNSGLELTTQIIDSAGKVVVSTSRKTKLNVVELINGLYFLKITDPASNNSVVSKVLISHR